MRFTFLALGVLAALLILPNGAAASPEHTAAPETGDPNSPGGKVFAQRCSACHDHPVGRIPPRSLLAYKEPDAIVRALSTGVMRQQATGLGKSDIDSLALFHTGQQPGLNNFPADANRCPKEAKWGSPASS